MIIDRARVAGALPGYELGAELGVGGFGLVLAARHRVLGRQVAVKIVDAGHSGSATEAQLLARLDHPHIVRVYDYVEAGSFRLVVMELLGGGTLTRRQKGMPPEGACATGLAVATALSCAHAQGVLHRDIKPDNVLFDAAGLPKVTDFGVAKLVEGSAATASAVAGTPAYMAPEQITGGRLGPATDIYALGVVLYHLLAGSPPFDPTLGVQALWQHHLGTEPAPPPGVPTPVAQVVLHALAKDPAARPPSAQALAIELAHAAARAYGPGWTARSRIALHVGGDVRDAADSLPTPTLPAPTPRVPPPQIADIAAGNSPPVVKQGKQAEGHPSDEEVPDDLVGTTGGPGPGPGSATTHRGGGHPGSRENTALGRRRLRRCLSAAAVPVLLLLFAAVIGNTFAARSDSGENPTPNPPQLGPPLTGHGWSSVVFAPDGAILVTGGGYENKAAVLWDIADPTRPRELGRILQGHTDELIAVAFSPDGRTLATSSRDQAVRLWDVADPAHAHPFGQLPTGPTDTVSVVAFSPDGRILATGSEQDEAARLWDVADPAHPRMLGTTPESADTQFEPPALAPHVTSLTFSPSGRILAAGSEQDDAVRLWDVGDPAHINPYGPPLAGHTGGVTSIAFSPDGRTLATSSFDGIDGTTWLWDTGDSAHSPRRLGQPLVHTGDGVFSSEFSPDGRTLAAGTFDAPVQLWDVLDPDHPHLLGPPLKGHTGAVYSVAFSPDGQILASGGADDTVRLWAVG